MALAAGGQPHYLSLGAEGHDVAMIVAKIPVRLRAGAGRDRLGGIRNGRLIAKVSAPPVDGRANRGLRLLIARRVGVAPSRVTILWGERSRDKLISVEGVGGAELLQAFELVCAGSGNGVGDDPMPAGSAFAQLWDPGSQRRTVARPDPVISAAPP